MRKQVNLLRNAGKEKKQEYYSNDFELLEDYYRAIMGLSSKSAEPGFTRNERIPSKEGFMFSKARAGIRKKLRSTRRRTIPLKFLELMLRYRLNDLELFIIGVLVLADIKSEIEFLSNPKKLVELIAGEDISSLVQVRKMFQADSRLRKGAMRIVKERFLSDRVTIELGVRALILGEKVPVVQAPRKKEIRMLTAKQVYAELDKYIIGQDLVKKKVAVAAANHLRRISMLHNSPGGGKVSLPKSNMIFVGPTGVGKTYICQILSNILDIPFAICDATGLSETGYVGGCVDDMVGSLYRASGMNTKMAEKGIIYIDEIDKISSKSPIGHSTDRDVSGEGVQQDMLKLLEGKLVNINSNNPNTRHNIVNVDTSNMLFIAGGAFSGIEKAGAEEKRSIGFVQGAGLAGRPVSSRISQNDIIEYGMLPEFVGRFPVLAELDKLTTRDLERVMTEPEDSVIKQYSQMFKISGRELKVDNEVIKWVAQNAAGQRTGARAVRTIMEELLTPIMYDLDMEAEEDAREIIVGMEMVEKYCNQQLG